MLNQDVKLASIIMPATTPQAKTKHLFFLHGLLGRGNNWKDLTRKKRVLP